MIEIKYYCSADQDPVIELILQIQTEEFGVDISEQDQPDLKQVTSFYQKGTGQFWVAKLGQEIIGTIALLDIGNKQCALRKMFVKKAYRGAQYQVAQHLLESLLVWSKNHMVKEIYLGTINKYKAAHRFYEKNNFQICLKSELPNSFPLVAVDNVFYKLSVS